MATSVPAPLFNRAPSKGIANSISERLSSELVIGLVGPVGSGVSTAAQYIEQILSQEFAYDVCPIIKPSDIIRDESHRVGIVPPPRKPISAYISAMQDAGNGLREQFGPDYLAEKAVERIVAFRHKKG